MTHFHCVHFAVQRQDVGAAPFWVCQGDPFDISSITWDFIFVLICRNVNNCINLVYIGRILVEKLKFWQFKLLFSHSWIFNLSASGTDRVSNCCNQARLQWHSSLLSPIFNIWMLLRYGVRSSKLVNELLLRSRLTKTSAPEMLPGWMYARLGLCEMLMEVVMGRLVRLLWSNWVSVSQWHS